MDPAQPSPVFTRVSLDSEDGRHIESKTDALELATETGLAESMRKFDASRFIPVADETPIAPPSIGNEDSDKADKSTLH